MTLHYTFSVTSIITDNFVITNGTGCERGGTQNGIGKRSGNNAEVAAY